MELKHSLSGAVMRPAKASDLSDGALYFSWSTTSGRFEPCVSQQKEALIGKDVSLAGKYVIDIERGNESPLSELKKQPSKNKELQSFVQSKVIGGWPFSRFHSYLSHGCKSALKANRQSAYELYLNWCISDQCIAPRESPEKWLTFVFNGSWESAMPYLQEHGIKFPKEEIRSLAIALEGIGINCEYLLQRSGSNYIRIDETAAAYYSRKNTSSCSELPWGVVERALRNKDYEGMRRYWAKKMMSDAMDHLSQVVTKFEGRVNNCHITKVINGKNYKLVLTRTDEE